MVPGLLALRFRLHFLRVSRFLADVIGDFGRCIRWLLRVFLAGEEIFQTVPSIRWTFSKQAYWLSLLP